MTLAIIPARMGSKGIKNKNLSNLGGKPLIFYTIESAKSATCIDEIVVSSDGDEILEYASSLGVQILRRPTQLALDDTTSDKVVLHTLESYDCDMFILLQPTSPFRTADDIDKAFEIFVSQGYDALISVQSCDNKILKAFLGDKHGNLHGIHNNIYPFMPRQQLPKTYMSNGAIYIVKKALFWHNPIFLQPHTGYYEMDILSSIDIDNPRDLVRANKILQRQIKQQK